MHKMCFLIRLRLLIQFISLKLIIIQCLDIISHIIPHYLICNQIICQPWIYFCDGGLGLLALALVGHGGYFYFILFYLFFCWLSYRMWFVLIHPNYDQCDSIWGVLTTPTFIVKGFLFVSIKKGSFIKKIIIYINFFIFIMQLNCSDINLNKIKISQASSQGTMYELEYS